MLRRGPLSACNTSHPGREKSEGGKLSSSVRTSSRHSHASPRRNSQSVTTLSVRVGPRTLDTARARARAAPRPLMSRRVDTERSRRRAGSAAAGGGMSVGGSRSHRGARTPPEATSPRRAPAGPCGVFGSSSPRAVEWRHRAPSARPCL
eukprot:6260915-Prymnesium_polylepis.1